MVEMGPYSQFPVYVKALREAHAEVDEACSALEIACAGQSPIKLRDARLLLRRELLDLPRAEKVDAMMAIKIGQFIEEKAKQQERGGR